MTIDRHTPDKAMPNRLPTIRTFPRVMLLTLLLVSVSVSAAPQVQVVGLFKDRAVLLIDGRQRLLRAGQTSPEGVTLISADSEQAVLEIDGERSVRALGTRNALTFDAAPAPRSVLLLPDKSNSYVVSGSINGFSVRFVLDTGASAVVLSGREAKRIGIDYERLGTSGMADTPTGPTPTHHVVLDRVRVGEIELRDVDGLVIAGEFPRDALLGMSFVGRLELRQNGRIMELRVPH